MIIGAAPLCEMSDSEAAQRSAVVTEAMTWLGTPYHHHGRIKGVGVDCLTLLAEVFERAGLVAHVDPGNYSTQWYMHRSEELYQQGLMRYCVRRPDGSRVLPGDVLLYRVGRCYSHGAIAVHHGQILHSYVGRGVILTRSTEEPLVGLIHQHWSMWP